MKRRRPFRTWLAAAMLALLPFADARAQFVTPGATRWQTPPESPIAAPSTPRRDLDARDATAAQRRDRAATSAVAAPYDGEPSYATYALWGIGIGGGLGLALGAFGDRDGACHDCWVDAKTLGAVGGALFGWIVASIAYFGSQDPADLRR